MTQWCTEVFTLTTLDEDFEKTVQWMKANITLNNKVTIMIKKRPQSDVEQSKISTYFTMMEEKIVLKPERHSKIIDEHLIQHQELTKSQQIDKILKEARNSMGKKSYQEALQLLMAANEVYKTLDDSVDQKLTKSQLFSICLSFGICYKNLLDMRNAISHWMKFIDELYNVQDHEIRIQFQDDKIQVLNNLAQYFFDQKDQNNYSQSYYLALIDAINQLPIEKKIVDKEIQLIEANSIYQLGVIEIYANNKSKNYEPAIKYFRDSIEKFKQIYGENHISVANKQHNLAETYRQIEQFDNSILFFMQSYEIKKNEYKLPHKSTALTIYQIALTYQKMKNVDEAFKFGYEGLELMKGILETGAMTSNEFNEQTGRFHKLLGDVNQTKQNNQKALDHYESGFRQLKGALTENHKETIDCAKCYASLLMREKQYDEAKRIFELVDLLL